MAIRSERTLRFEVQWLPIARLLLDPDNPRLATAVPDTLPSQARILEHLWRNEALDEIALSIAENGYYQQEPLLVVPVAPDNLDGQFHVVEGNRRFASVLLLLHEHERVRLQATELPRISPSRALELQVLPVLIYPSRKSLWSYLGFRHINGTKPWDAFSKAKYVADVHEKYNVPLGQIARQIGDRHDTVERLYRGLKVLEQAEEAREFDREDRSNSRFFFSHLYTAVDQGDFQRFLGVSGKTSLKPRPVPPSKRQELRDLMTWLYGSKAANKPPLVRSQNPDLNTLREVVASKRGVEALRSGLSLAAAHEASIGEPRRFKNALARAYDELKTAKSTVTNGYGGESELRETAQFAANLAASIAQEMDDIDRKRGRKP